MNAIASPVRRKLNPPQPAGAPFPFHPGSLLSVNDLTLDALNLLDRQAGGTPPLAIRFGARLSF